MPHSASPQSDSGMERSNNSPDELGFAFLCVQKAVEFSIKDHKLHRAAKDAELHEELEKLTDAGPSVFLYQLGGGCRVVGTATATGAALYSGCVGDSVAAFQGSLSNLANLAKEYVPEGAAQDNPAEVICHMYLKVGVELLTKLVGRFSFCMYESKQGRVLAARDGSGSMHLYQGHSPNEGLVIASTKAMLTTCSDVKPFAPGDFKYGWHSEPRQFSPMEFQRGRPNHNGRKSISDHVRRTERSSHLSQADRRGTMGEVQSAGRQHHGKRSTPVSVATPNNSWRMPSSRPDSLPTKGGKWMPSSFASSDSSSCGSTASGEKLSAVKRAATVAADEMRVLSIDAPEFTPTWGSQAMGVRGACGVMSPAFPAAVAHTVV